MAQQKTVAMLGSSLMVGALVLGSAVPAGAVTSVATENTPTSTAAIDATDPATGAKAPEVSAAQAAIEAANDEAARNSAKPTKRTTTPVTMGMLKSGSVVLKRGSAGPAVTKIQGKLTDVGIITKVTGVYNKQTALNAARFNEKFRGFAYKQNKDITQYGWKKLRKASKTKIPKKCLKQKAALCISKEQKVVRYYKKGRLVTALDARFGGQGYRTREGNWRIFRKVKDDFSSLYQTPMPWSMYFSGGQAVHYSFYFPKDGYNGASHGCVNIRDKKGIKKLWKKVKIGTFAKVY